MKKTLKILMAIILFAVVLTIATSVNAASYTTIEKAIEEEEDLKAVTPTYVPAIEIKDGSYVVNSAVTITEKITATDMKLKLNATLTAPAGVVFSGNTIIKQGAAANVITGDVQNNGTLTVPGEIATKILNKGTLYVSGSTALTTATVNEDNGVIYTDAGIGTVTGNVQLTLKDEVRHDNVTYTKIIVPTKDIDAKLDYKVTEIIEKGNVAATNKVEAGKTYILKVKVTYDGKEIVNPTVELVAPKNFDAKQNCQITSSDDGEIKVVAKKDLDGNTITLGAKLKNVTGSEKDLAPITIGEEIKNEEPNKPENPDNKPEEPAKPSDDKKGDLDDAAAVATGDHIIPATALLAVVVVANVVYFAKSKNN